MCGSCVGLVEAGQGLRTFLVNVCEHTLHVKGLLELIIVYDCMDYMHILLHVLNSVHRLQ